MTGPLSNEQTAHTVELLKDDAHDVANLGAGGCMPHITGAGWALFRAVERLDRIGDTAGLELVRLARIDGVAAADDAIRRRHEAEQQRMREREAHRLSVACPKCDAQPGRKCRTPSGHKADPHRARRDALAS